MKPGNSCEFHTAVFYCMNFHAIFFLLEAFKVYKKCRAIILFLSVNIEIKTIFLDISRLINFSKNDQFQGFLLLTC